MLSERTDTKISDPLSTLRKERGRIQNELSSLRRGRRSGGTWRLRAVHTFGSHYRRLLLPAHSPAAKAGAGAPANDNLKKNDQVVTSGGLYGRIEDIQGDQLRLEIAPGVIVKHERRQIAAVRSNKDK
jgi:hypothetical protein